MGDCDVGDQYASSVIAGNIIGALIGLTVTILSSMVVCCGKMVPKAKMIGGISMGLGGLCLVIPAISGVVASGQVVSTICDDKTCNPNGCSDAHRSSMETTLATFGVIGSYLIYGWLDVIFGILGLSLGGAACCGCCKAKGDAAVGAQGQVVVVQAQPTA